MIYVKKFDNHSQYESFKGSTDFDLPNVSLCRSEGNTKNKIHYNQYDPNDPAVIRNKYRKQYLTFEIIDPGSIYVQAIDSNTAGKIISYSTDNGSTWNSITTSTTAQSLGSSYSGGQKILVKGLNDTYGSSISYINFTGDSYYKVYGNIMSLIYDDDFVGKTSFPSGSTYTFCKLFYGSTNLVDASNLILPATTLSSNCYLSMFQYCTSLTKAPELPATTLAKYCYYMMFRGCTSLTQVSELPATTLANYCYCYMFYNCTRLTQAPELPATTLAEGCYNGIFSDCTSLSQSPELPGTTLVNACYANMFSGCTSLNYIKAMFTTTPNTSYTQNWVSGVATTGTFIKNSAATWNVTGINGVPSGWTVQTASS